MNRGDAEIIYQKLMFKLFAASFAAVRRVFLPFSSPINSIPNSSASSMTIDVVKLQYCDEEFDKEIREAKFAFRTTDLGNWASSFPTGGSNTNSDPTIIQHWALVVHFPREGKTYLFEAWGDENNRSLQPGRAEILFKDIQVFDSATYFGTTMTSPYELLEKAKRVKTGKYNTINNNCQTWLKEFLRLIDPELLTLLSKKNPMIHLA